MSQPPQNAVPLEAAYVLFMDLVAYSRMPTDEQRRILTLLQVSVRSSKEFLYSQSRTRLLCLPTGDGMVLAFFDEPEAPLRCAIELTLALREHPEIKVRMGIHAGPVYRVEDINLSRNVAGGGVNIAQRVMDCGDTGHILVSSSAAEYLSQVTAWSGSLHDLGDATVKHGEHVHLYNFYTEEIGNSRVPSKILRARKKQKLNKVLATVLVTAVATALATLYIYFYGRFGPRKTVAVLDLKNEVGLPDVVWVGNQFSDELSAELGKNDRLRLISRDRVVRTNKDLSVSAGVPLAMMIPTLRQDLAADFIISGSYWDTAGVVRVEVRVQDAVTGKIITVWSGSELEDRVNQLAVQASLRTVQQLGIGTGIRNKFHLNDGTDDDPKLPETKKLLAIGLRLLRDFDAVEAKETLLSASLMEPNSPSVHAALGDAWSVLGFRDAARTEFKKAYELSSNIPKKQQLVIAAKLSEASDQPEMTVRDYSSLFEQFPDDVDIGLGLAKARIRASRPGDAMDTIGRLRHLTPPSRDDPRIDLVEAEAEEIISKYSAMQTSASVAIKKAGSQRMIYARGKELEGIALRRLGFPKEAVSALSSAWSSYQASGDRIGAATALLQIGKIRRDTGDLREAERIFKNCSAIYEEVGNHARKAESMNMIGETLWEKGNLDQAKIVFQQGIELSQSIGDKLMAANMLGNLGSVLYSMGDLDNAEGYHQRSIELYSVLGDSDHRANELNNLANLYHDRGELDAAQGMHEQAIALAEKSGQKKTLAGARSAYGELLTDKGELGAAREQHKVALKIWTEIKDPMNAAYDRVALAGLDVEENNVDGVEVVTRSAIATFVDEEEYDKAVVAETVLTRALLLQRRIPDARREVARTIVLMKGTQPPYAKYEFAIVSAMVDSKSGNVVKAVKSLRQLTSQLAKTRYVCYQLKTKLLLDELQLQGKNSDEVRADLYRVMEDANRKGLGLISREAEAGLREN